ncbi:hypothetical protein [Gilliamella sp. ESL0250]|uniref:hypothetical protein n=1 Tax=Gilliamella sp. ESL0250 TaxID=2705036 RepID=UPI0015804D20|nr:hypothetical protein [Gilliamella sp. ESL0250]NUF50705.1 hypothetical protein [Gilliamella sp. ESL0250]
MVDNGATGLMVIYNGKTYHTQTAEGLSKILGVSTSDAELLFSLSTGAVTAKGLSNLAWKARATGQKLSEKELETIKRQIDRESKLTVDPHAGKVKLAEGAAAIELEKLLGGKVERIKDKDSLADFIFTSGPNKGKTVDFMFTTSNGTEREINAMNKFFNNNWDRNIKKLHEHLDKADIVPLDFRKLTSDNRTRLENYIKTLPEYHRSKIHIMR